MYVAVYWAVRVGTTPVVHVSEYLATWWQRLGYWALTLLFVGLVAVYGWAALRPSLIVGV